MEHCQPCEGGIVPLLCRILSRTLTAFLPVCTGSYNPLNARDLGDLKAVEEKIIQNLEDFYFAVSKLTLLIRMVWCWPNTNTLIQKVPLRV